MKVAQRLLTLFGYMEQTSSYIEREKIDVTLCRKTDYKIGLFNFFTKVKIKHVSNVFNRKKGEKSIDITE